MEPHGHVGDGRRETLMALLCESRRSHHCRMTALFCAVRSPASIFAQGYKMKKGGKSAVWKQGGNQSSVPSRENV